MTGGSLVVERVLRPVFRCTQCTDMCWTIVLLFSFVCLYFIFSCGPLSAGVVVGHFVFLVFLFCSSCIYFSCGPRLAGVVAGYIAYLFFSFFSLI